MLLAVVVSDPLPVLDVAVVSDPLPVFVLTDEHLRRDVSDGGDLTLKNGGERRGVERIDPVGERVDPVGEWPLMDAWGDAQGDRSIGVAYDGDDVLESLKVDTGDS